MIGPFDDPLLPDLIYSPLNLVPKAGGGKDDYRLIHDLSHPYTDQSINACIPQCNSSVQYEYIDRVIDIVSQIGSKAWGCRIDFRIGLSQPAYEAFPASIFGIHLQWENLY